MGQRTAGDLMFEAYLQERGYPDPEHEPDLGTRKRPDYVLERGGQRCVCEVKEFNKDTRSTPDQPYGVTDLKTVLKPIRSQIREAARQLKDVADLGLPLVVVLTNPHGAWVNLGEREMVWAMYGDPIVVMPVDTGTGAAIGEPEHTVGRHGKLARDHQYISAVAKLSQREHASDWFDEMSKRYKHLPANERWECIEAAIRRGEKPEGTYYQADVFKTLSTSAALLPDVFFDGPNDRVFEFEEERGTYVQVRGRRVS